MDVDVEVEEGEGERFCFSRVGGGGGRDVIFRLVKRAVERVMSSTWIRR